jgi:uncharacterized repeat protein (TIGR03803 family)
MTSPTNPFSHVTIIDPNITDPIGGTYALSITFSGGGTLTDGADFGGTRTLSGSNGSYTLNGTPAAINAELDALSFIGVPGTPVSFTLSEPSIATVTVSFTDGADGAFPLAGLISDAAGNLFGTTTLANNGSGGGTVFEIANIGTVSAPIYSSTPTTLWSFGDGFPHADLIRDAAGNLFGTASDFTQNFRVGNGAVFEIPNTGTVSAPVYGTLTTLWSFRGGADGRGFNDGGNPQGNLILDAAGDLFGTTQFGGDVGFDGGYGTVFKLVNTGTVSAPAYTSAPTILWSFTDGADGAFPLSGLIRDAAGDLFGTTASTVFELVNTGTVSAPVYSGAPTTLHTFTGGTDGGTPVGSLAIDAAGRLFGTTVVGGDFGYGTVFEIANGTLTTLVSFDGTNGNLHNPIFPRAGLIIDAAGDLFGTTGAGGTYNQGTVFELVNSGTVSAPDYTSFQRGPIILWNFTGGTDGAFPEASLTIDAAGDLFGTTSDEFGGGFGSVFELVRTDSGYTMAPSFTGTLAGQTTVSEAPVKPFSHVTITDPNNTGRTNSDPHSGGTGTDTLSIMFSGGGTLTDGAGFAGTRTLSGSNGHYTLTGIAADITAELDALSFTPPVNGVPNTQVTTHFTLFDQGGATPDVLASFDYFDGAFPLSSLISDAAGNLLGTTSGGPGGIGTVFEIANTGTVSAPVYSSTHTTLWSFTGGGDEPIAGLVRDAAGNLFGTASLYDTTGTVFEIANTGSVSAPVYSSTPTTLVSFNGTDGGYPAAGLIVDAAGNLFGTTEFGGPGDRGTVFEIANSGSASAPVYSSTPTTLWFFTGGADGRSPAGSLISDAAGDLFGTTSGDLSRTSTVFEIANTGTVSAPVYGTLTTLASFGGEALAGLMRDAAGDLLGTTLIGGAGGGLGTVFELVNTGTVSAPSYGSTPATLVSFTGGDDGGEPFGGLVSDAAGDLFGTTSTGGPGGLGTVFEIVNTGTVSAPVYSHTPTTLWSFTGGADGADPHGSLTIDAAGDLFGTASEGGISGTGVNAGTVFELVRTGSVYTFLSAIDTTTSVIDSDPAVAPTITGTVAGQTTTSEAPVTPFSHVTITDANNGGTDIDTLSITLAGGGTLSGTGLSGSSGSYTLTGTAAAITAELDALSFTPVNGVPNTQVATTFTLSDTSTAGTTSASDSVTTVIDHDPAVAPTITGTLAGQTTVSEAPVTPFSHVMITDANDGGTDTDTLSITLSGGGTLAGTGLSGSNGSYTLTGTAADITAELDALSFTPVNGLPNTQVTTTFTLSDASGAGTTSASDSVTSVIDHDPAVAPTIAGTVAGQTTTSETPVTPFSHVTIADANNGGTDTDTLSITLSGGGALSGTGLSGSNGSYTLTGTAADITAELDALSFTPVGVPNTQVATTFTLSDTSTAGTTSASDGVTTVIDHDPAVAPTITGTLAGQTTVSEAPVTPFSHVTVTDANDGGTDIDTLSIALSGGGALSGTGLSGSNGSYTLTGTAAAISAELDALSFTPVNGVPDTSVTTTFTLSDSSTAGTTSASNSVTTVIDHDPPIVNSVTASTVGNISDLDAAEVVTITVNFSGPVAVTGTPELQLNDSEVAAYTGGTGTSSLTFGYTVQPGDNIADLQVQGLLLNNGTIKDGVGSNASVANAVADLHLQIDTTAPSPPPTLALIHDTGASSSDRISSDPSIIYSAPAPGDTLLYKADSGSFSTVVPTFATDHTADGLHTVTVEEVDPAGNISTASLSFTLDTIAPALPTLALLHDTGVSNSDHITSDPTITYLLSAIGDTLLYRTDGGSYSAVAPTFATDHSADGPHTVSIEEVDAAGNISSPTNLSFMLDTIAPAQTSIAALADNGHTDVGIGHVVTITVDTGDAVTVTGTPTLTLSDGATARYAAGSGTTALTFDYTVATGDHTSDLHVTGYTGSIHDVAGNALAPVTGDIGLQIDGVAPTGVLSFVTDSGGTDLNHGHVVTFTLATSENVTVTGTPELQLSDGEFATYSSGASTASALAFSYTVAAGDNSADLHVAGTNPNGGLVLNGGTILDAVGNPLAGSVSTDTHLIIDTTAPVVSGITASPGSGGVFTGSTVELTLAFNEAVTLTGTPSLTLNDGATATYDAAATTALHDATKFVFDYLVSASDQTPSLAVTGFAPHGATIHDLAGNAADLNNVTAAFAALSINENIAPAYTIGGLTRPALELDQTGHIVLDQAATDFEALYGTKALYMGLPASTPYPPVVDTHPGFHLV